MSLAISSQLLVKTVHYYICGKGRCIIGAETIEKSQVCEHKVYQQTD